MHVTYINLTKLLTQFSNICVVLSKSISIFVGDMVYGLNFSKNFKNTKTPFASVINWIKNEHYTLQLFLNFFNNNRSNSVKTKFNIIRCLSNSSMTSFLVVLKSN